MPTHAIRIARWLQTFVSRTTQHPADTYASASTSFTQFRKGLLKGTSKIVLWTSPFISLLSAEWRYILWVLYNAYMNKDIRSLLGLSKENNSQVRRGTLKGSPCFSLLGKTSWTRGQNTKCSKRSSAEGLSQKTQQAPAVCW